MSASGFFRDPGAYTPADFANDAADAGFVIFAKAVEGLRMVGTQSRTDVGSDSGAQSHGDRHFGVSPPNGGFVVNIAADVFHQVFTGNEHVGQVAEQ